MKTITIWGREFNYVDEVPEVKLVSFLSRINFDGPNGCWEWETSGCRRNGSTTLYGVFSYHNQNIVAHRFAWIALVGPLDQDKQVHHKCRNTVCVNPEHLQPLTCSEHLLEHTPTNPVAIQANRTHCIRGHALSGDNLYWHFDRHGYKHRRCVTCRRDWAREKYQKEAALKEKKPKVLPTHCKNGHELTEENVYNFHGIKSCRLCHNANCAKYYAKKRETREPKPHWSKAGRSHCKNGHPWVEENLYHTVSRGRPTTVCKTCQLAAHARRADRLKAQFAKVDEGATNNA